MIINMARVDCSYCVAGARSSLTSCFSFSLLLFFFFFSCRLFPSLFYCFFLDRSCVQHTHSKNILIEEEFKLYLVVAVTYGTSTFQLDITNSKKKKQSILDCNRRMFKRSIHAVRFFFLSALQL